eukprot:scaffold625_cov324-Pavlova_lutheri.AAC.116
MVKLQAPLGVACEPLTNYTITLNFSKEYPQCFTTTLSKDGFSNHVPSLCHSPFLSSSSRHAYLEVGPRLS